MVNCNELLFRFIFHALRSPSWFVGLTLYFLIGPARAADTNIESRPLAPASPVPPGLKTMFEAVDGKSVGVDFEHYWVEGAEQQDAKERTYVSEGGGVTIGDVDGDSRPDIYLSRPFGGGRLYRNLGDFRFEDITASSGLAEDKSWGAGVSFVDIDNDRDLDLFICAYHTPNRLYVNDGRGHFTEQSEKYGLAFKGASVMISFADYDRDGDLDGYLALNRYEFDAQGRPMPKSGRVEVVRDPFGGFRVPSDLLEQFDVIVRPDTRAPVLVKAGQFNRMYRNEGGNRFTEVAAEAGVRDNSLTLAATWWDYNHDGWPDLYVANDYFGPDRLYENQKDGTFKDIAPEKLPHTPWYSMGTDVGDLNNDGLLDFIATDMAGATHYKANVGRGDLDKTSWFLESGQPRQYVRNAVYINAGPGHPFLEIAHQANLDATDWTWSPKLGDFDCDGRLDLFITNGMTGDFFNSDFQALLAGPSAASERSKMSQKRDPDLAYRNTGDLTFEDVSQRWGLGEENVSFGAGLADLDEDGDLDIVVNRFKEPVALYRNHTPSGNRIKIALRGTRSNAYGLDALVRLRTAAGAQAAYHTLARGFMSTNEPLLHFGLGDASRIERLEVRWPSGHVQTFENLPVNHQFTITEPDSTPPAQPPAEPKPNPLYVATNHLGWARHNEIPHNDFADQPLLPNKLSQLGPGIAVADVGQRRRRRHVSWRRRGTTWEQLRSTKEACSAVRLQPAPHSKPMPTARTWAPCSSMPTATAMRIYMSSAAASSTAPTARGSSTGCISMTAVGRMSARLRKRCRMFATAARAWPQQTTMATATLICSSAAASCRAATRCRPQAGCCETIRSPAA